MRLDGDEDARALLGATLTWTATRIDAAFAACAILSGRFEPVSRAWGWAPGHGGSIDPLLEARLGEETLAPQRLVALGGRLESDPSLPTVFAVGPGDVAPGLAVLLERLGLSLPHVLALRSRGRLVCLLMICREATAEVGSDETTRVLRRIQPLAEAAVDPDAVLALHPQATDILGERGLTPRERAIAELAVSGAGNPEIAAELGIAPTTVRNHMSRILRKFGIRSRAELIAIYVAAERAGRMDM